MSILKTTKDTFIEFNDCYHNGTWRKDVPFVSICGNPNCMFNGLSYCSNADAVPICRNRLRDNLFRQHFDFENDTDYYPSDAEDLYRYRSKCLKKLLSVQKKPYYMAGRDMYKFILTAADNYSGTFYGSGNEAAIAALEIIRSLRYNISVKKWKDIAAMFNK